MTKMSKFDRKVTESIIKPHLRTMGEPGFGIVITYDQNSNTATVLMAQKGSDAAGEIYHNVPCPTTMGVQTVAPDPGRQCAVTFKNGNIGSPIITNFFNYMYEQFDYSKQNTAPAPMPYFMRGM